MWQIFKPKRTQSQSWSSFFPTIKSMHAKRAISSAAVVVGRIYVTGGSEDSSSMTAIESYDPDRDSWTQLAHMNKLRNTIALIESNGLLYSFGYSKIAEEYDPSTDRWTEVW